jgi:hypothetical protein
MPRTDWTVQETSRLTGLANPTKHTPDVANGNSFDNSGNKTFLYVTNGGAGSTVCTIAIPNDFEGEPLADKTYTITAGQRMVIGPFGTAYEQTDNGLTRRVLVNFSVSTSVTVEVMKLGSAT